MHCLCERSENTLSVPAGSAVTLYAALAGETVIVERISAIGLEKGVVIVYTSRNERFFFAYEDVRALRVLES